MRRQRSMSSDAPLKAKAAPPDAEKTPKYSSLYIFCCIGYYFIVSLSLTFLNKMVLTTMIKFSCPLFMTWLQFVVAFVCLKVLGYAGRWAPSIPLTIGVHNYDFSSDIFKKTFRLGLSYVAMVSITNVTLFSVNLLLFQFVRALVIPFSIIITYTTQRSLPSFKASVACCFVVIGFFIGTLSDEDDTSTWQGVACGVLSSLVCAMYGVEVKRALQVLGNDTFKTLYYNTIWGLVMLLPCIWLFEGRILVAEVTKLCGSTVHLGFFFFTAIMGFMISISYVLNIRCSSPLTSHIVGSSKSALQSILVLCIPSFQPSNSKEELNVPNLFGLLVVMAASLLYSFFQYQKGQADKSPATKK